MTTPAVYYMLDTCCIDTAIETNPKPPQLYSIIILHHPEVNVMNHLMKEGGSFRYHRHILNL